MGKLGASIFNATVDLNPHQLDAALFAFRSPLSRGAILADEVGLGKTIEAGLIISQLWAERRRRILVVCPTILRKQWAQELADKFFLPSVVLDSKEYNATTRAGRNALAPRDQVVICSYHFVAQRQQAVMAEPWDLVVIDEAHRLRNVWKPSNRIASAIHAAVSHRPLVLLTATPLQNSLMELYGLVSFLDEHIFGSQEAFKARYMRGQIEDRQLGELRHRLQPICQRTLRRQVQEYVRFTNRIAIVQDFVPTRDEQALYDMVSEYLQRPSLHALPASQRALMTLILRKLLASSTFAISKTLTALGDRLQDAQRDLERPLADDYDSYDETAEEWSGAPLATTTPPALAHEIEEEISELRQYASLADSISENSKGLALLQALEKGFVKMEELGAARKAVIFTASRRTPQYILDLLDAAGYGGRVMTINGTNTDDLAGAVYKAWLARHEGEPVVSGNKTVDLRAALVEHFRDHADILIATEAASEGVNLQFCSLVVNYDLPWNPQRIEQRIGRCHRYGQQHDVVVINFLNRANEADQRVFELLREKFQLFDGVFGSSDEVLGALESGVDFERRIAEIYQSCRTKEEIDAKFDELRADLNAEIQSRMADTRVKLFENFDEDVHQRLKVSRDESVRQLDRLERALWTVTRQELAGQAEFDDDECQFVLDAAPAIAPDVPAGEYRFLRRVGLDGLAQPYRLGHPLAQALLEQAKGRDLPSGSVAFDYSAARRKIGLLESLVGRSGWLRVVKMTTSSFEEEDRLLAAVVADGGEVLHADVVESLFQIEGRSGTGAETPVDVDAALASRLDHLRDAALAENDDRNRKYFEEEVAKLDRWSDDLKNGLQVEIKELDSAIKVAKREAVLAQGLEAKIEGVRKQKELESLRGKKRRELYEAEDAVEAQRDDLIEIVAARLKQQVETEPVLTLRWTVE